MITMRILEFPGYVAGEDGHIYSYKVRERIDYTITPRRLKAHPGRTSPYLSVVLRKNGKSFTRNVHRLVCTTWHGRCPVGMTASHINGKNHDNRPINLKWETKKENDARKYEHGTDDLGVRNSRARFNLDDIRAIRDLLSLGKSCADIARFIGGNFKNTTRAVGKIKRGERYRGQAA